MICSMRKLAAPVFGAVTVAVVCAPGAHADQWDFISEIDNRGVYYSDISEMIDTGKLVCATVRKGSNVAAVNAVGRYLTGDRNFSGTEAGIIVMSAAQNMCPDITPFLQAYGQSAAQQRQGSA